MGHAAIATYIRPGHPREFSSESSIGNVWVYRGPSATISANKPAIGETWADGRPVVACEIYEISGASALSDMSGGDQTSVVMYLETKNGL